MSVIGMGAETLASERGPELIGRPTLALAKVLEQPIDKSFELRDVFLDSAHLGLESRVGPLMNVDGLRLHRKRGEPRLQCQDLPLQVLDLPAALLITETGPGGRGVRAGRLGSCCCCCWHWGPTRLTSTTFAPGHGRTDTDRSSQSGAAAEFGRDLEIARIVRAWHCPGKPRRIRNL